MGKGKSRTRIRRSRGFMSEKIVEKERGGGEEKGCSEKRNGKENNDDEMKAMENEQLRGREGVGVEEESARGDEERSK